MPLAPMGCTVLLHNKADIRKTNAMYAIEDFYIETSQKYYRCFNVWVKETQSVCIADTIFFKHKYITMPTVSKADAIVAATTNVAQVLKGKLEPNMGEKCIKQFK